MHCSQAKIDIPPKITLQPEFFLWPPFSLALLKDFLKICRINSLSSIKYGQNNKKNVKMYVTSFSSKIYGHMFISLKVGSVLQKKINRRDEKEVNKNKNKVMTPLIGAYISLPISSEFLELFFIFFSFQKTFIFYFFKNRF